MKIPPYTDAELRTIEALMTSKGAYTPSRPREVILRLIATIRAHHPKKPGRPPLMRR